METNLTSNYRYIFGRSPPNDKEVKEKENDDACQTLVETRAQGNEGYIYPI